MAVDARWIGLVLAWSGCARAEITPPPRPRNAPASTRAATTIAATTQTAADVATTETAQVDPSTARVDPPPREFFVDRDEVTVDEVVAEIDALADELADAPAIADDYAAFVETFALVDSTQLRRDYVRVKLAFEATRDGGWWGLRWKITHQQPNSDRIWVQWNDADPASTDAPSAWAECDELSALFAFFARKLGVRGVGLFWPTGNHVVAVWTVDGVQTRAGSSVRIVVPTSQIFLGEDDSLGTTGFDPWTQKTIFEYRRRDVKGEHRLRAPLARHFVAEIAAHGAKSQAQLQRERNDRDLRGIP